MKGQQGPGFRRFAWPAALVVLVARPDVMQIRRLEMIRDLARKPYTDYKGGVPPAWNAGLLFGFRIRVVVPR